MKDALGNELKVGDMVAIQLARPLIFGQIVEATDGGLVATIDQKGGAQMHPGRLVVISRHVIDFDPRMQIEALLALKNEQGHQAVRKGEEEEEGLAPLPN